jgi:arginyl-tRNA synthetase
MGVFFRFVFWDVVGDFRVLTEHVKTRDVGKLFQALISRLEDASQLDRVATEIATLLTENLSSETVSVANPKVLFCFLKTATLGKKRKKVVRHFLVLIGGEGPLPFGSF